MKWYEETMLNEHGKHSTKTEDFDLLLQLSLWGNRCDLSLSGGNEAAAESSKHGPEEETRHLKPFLLVDHSKQVWQWLSSVTDKPQRIDIILDNAGYELINDLLLVDWLLHQQLADGSPAFEPIFLHYKSMPWFVSDTNLHDFEYTLKWLQDRPNSKGLAGRIAKMVENGRLKLETHKFWTSPHHFWRISEIAPDLFTELKKSRILIFKGDLNGRKMFADLKWKPTDKLQTAVGPLAKLFAPSKTALCLARTLKCEVAFGIDETKYQEIQSKSPDWSYSGKYGEIQAIIP